MEQMSSFQTIFFLEGPEWILHMKMLIKKCEMVVGRVCHEYIWEICVKFVMILINNYDIWGSPIMMLNSVAGHHYETRVADAFVVASNDALLSCSLPSFASEYLSVLAWVTSEGLEVSSSHLGGKPESQGNTALRSIVDTRTLDSLIIFPSFPSIFILFLFLFICCYFHIHSFGYSLCYSLFPFFWFSPSLLILSANPCLCKIFFSFFVICFLCCSLACQFGILMCSCN